ncbi:hypothetical protein [Metabacillus halosaccharovorans]|uniref:hypothetical protein n=1 Tax=Metabacillus halosaccharovorans TaxID=930124 RepID=UPI001C1F6E7F|nr:hypothetical protein [Metabacillus halosaccharovorans]MBU7592363.1 hypothetical protein [Metabacillus halosaccharovorans]
MQCFCENMDTEKLKIEGDVDTDPVWCIDCGCNIDIEVVPISDDLKDELLKWAMMYGKWIDWSKDKLLTNSIELEDNHNKLGCQLTEKVKKELGTKYKVEFAPSSTARMYAHLNF